MPPKELVNATGDTLKSNSLVPGNVHGSQYPVGSILANKYIPSLPLRPTLYLSPYSLVGGVLGGLWGYEIAKRRRHNCLITTKYVADFNYGYVFWGGVLGACLGGVTRKLIIW